MRCCPKGKLHMPSQTEVSSRFVFPAQPSLTWRAALAQALGVSQGACAAQSALAAASPPATKLVAVHARPSTVSAAPDTSLAIMQQAVARAIQSGELAPDTDAQALAWLWHTVLASLRARAATASAAEIASAAALAWRAWHQTAGSQPATAPNALFDALPPSAPTLPLPIAAYYAYWGKAHAATPDAAPFHLLVYHALDVTAAGHHLVSLPGFSLASLADALGWPLSTVEALHRFFLAIHDIGKFARAFQGLAPGLSPALVLPVARKRYSERHDTLGWLLWRDYLRDDLDARLPESVDDFWNDWARIYTGHHGRPPKEASGSGWNALFADDFFCPEDVAAAQAFCEEMAEWLLPDDIPAPQAHHRVILQRYSWQLAGLGVLADWLGSDQTAFHYVDQPVALTHYWHNAALPIAARAVAACGLQPTPSNALLTPQALFTYLAQPTPLQALANTIPLKPGPQLFLLEDVTGAGKTEAALILTHRLMAAGRAQGVYVGLPTMATANQMYRRVGAVYRRLFAPEASPSLVLAHGARQLVAGFQQSILQGQDPVGDAPYHPGEGSATSQCSAWLADHRKKALLAQVGVGTVDQVLLSVLPVRHQSLRLLGLAGKVLIVDEVHAYDSYMQQLLMAVLNAHARQGGSVILLSATVPAKLRQQLVQAFQAGVDGNTVAEAIPADSRYPLVTHAAQDIDTHACDTRPALVRRVAVSWLHTAVDAQALVLAQAAAGRSVCWIRNTVADAREAYASLRAQRPDGHITLFHSRYAMGDRLDIEDTVLARYGPASTPAMRAGQILVATQVVEQSLDLDFDVLITDLAPIDLMIQRAGRLHRHVRGADGAPASQEGREPPVLWILAPEFTDAPTRDWYAAMFRGASHVYPDVGRLWLTQQVLREAGGITSPGAPGAADGVRALVEAVYGEATAEIPEALQGATLRYEGEVMAEVLQANFNLLKLDGGYRESSSQHWYEEAKVPTRLGEDTLPVYLARITSEGLAPWRDDSSHPWAMSAVSVEARRVARLPDAATALYDAALATLRMRYPQLREPALVVPLHMAADGSGQAQVEDANKQALVLRYHPLTGLELEKVY